MQRIVILAAALLAAGGAVAQSSPAGRVASALDRPAVTSKAAKGSVLLGAARAGNRVVVVGERGIALWSDDEGKSWQQANVPVSVTLTAVRFVSDKLGWATGHGGVVLHTLDGGASWQRQLDGIQAANAFLADAKARGDEAATREGERLVADGADKPFLDLHFFDEKRGIVVGAYNLAFQTEDGGATWKPIGSRFANPRAFHLYSIRARGGVVLVGGEQGVAFRSSDGGTTFERLTVPYQGSFFTAELPDDGALWLAGLRGNVWRSADGGVNWSQVSGTGPASITSSYLSPQGALLMTTQAGEVLAYQNGVLKKLPTPPGPTGTALVSLPSGVLVHAGLRGVSLIPPEVQGLSR